MLGPNVDVTEFLPQRSCHEDRYNPFQIRQINRMRMQKYRDKLYLEQREQMIDSLGSKSAVDEILPPQRKYRTRHGNLSNLQTLECPILFFFKHISYLISLFIRDLQCAPRKRIS